MVVHVIVKLTKANERYDSTLHIPIYAVACFYNINPEMRTKAVEIGAIVPHRAKAIVWTIDGASRYVRQTEDEIDRRLLDAARGGLGNLTARVVDVARKTRSYVRRIWRGSIKDELEMVAMAREYWMEEDDE